MVSKVEYKSVFSFAEQYLRNISPQSVDLGRYLVVEKSFTDLPFIFERMLESAQNRNMLPGVIQFLERRLEFKEILFGFDHQKVLDIYDIESLFEAFKQRFPVKNAESPRNLWRMFACSTLSMAEFLSNFTDAADFDDFVLTFTKNKITRAALPMLMEKEIYGFGFALACDFLKELGYTQYPKPDDHLMDVFAGLGICPRDQYQVYKAIIEMAEAVEKTAYYVDKTIWLICSGNYYLDGIEIPGRKIELLQTCNKNLIFNE